MLSKNSEYAIRALVFVQIVNLQNRRPGVVEISKETDTPPAYMAKILQTLTRHRLVSSRKGRGGGFYFTRDTDKLTLYDVIYAMEGNASFTRCGFGFRDCDDLNPCPLHVKYIKIRDSYFELAKTETILSTAEKIVNGEAVLKRITNPDI
jgi:Rrf2 family protein